MKTIGLIIKKDGKKADPKKDAKDGKKEA